MSQQAWSIVFAQLSPRGADDGGRVGRGRSDEAPAASTSSSASLSASDVALVRQIRDGDIGVFESMFHAEYQGLVTYLARMVGTTWDAEELVQGMFVQLWERRTTFAPRTSVRTYLYGAARHAALNHFRAARRPMPPAGTGHANASSLADAEVELRDLERAAVTAMLALPPRAREVWTLHREQGLTVPEIASHLGISPNTVKTQLARSLAAIREAVLPFLVVVLAVRL